MLRVTVAGVVSIVAGDGSLGDGGDALNARLNQPSDIWVSPDGQVTIADRGNHRIRQVAPSGIINTIAGTGTGGYAGDGRAATEAEIREPWSVAVDGSGCLLIADTGNGVIRLVDTSGSIFTLSLPAAADAERARPYGLFSASSGAVMFTEAEHHIVRRLAPVVSSLRLTARRSVAPADGQTSAGIEITANGIEWGSQVIGGRALQLAQSDGVDLVSSTPGRVVV